jgi:hypothetical protein
MTTYTWTDGTTGPWTTGADWSPAGPPGTADIGLLAGSTAYSVTIGTGTIAAGGATLNDAAATLDIAAGTLDLGPSPGPTPSGALHLQAGTIALGTGGVLLGGTLNESGGLLAISSGGRGTLTGLIVAASAAVSIDGNSSVNGQGLLQINDGDVNGGAVTGTIANAGTITVGAFGLLEAPGKFTNTGLITVADNGDLQLIGTFTASGLGTVALAAGAQILLQTASLALINAFTAAPGGAQLFDEEGVNLAGGTLELGSADPFATAEFALGAIQTGTIVENAGGALKLTQGDTLSDITLLGQLTASNATIDVTGGLLVRNAAGGAPGGIALNGVANNRGGLDYLARETLDQVGIALSDGFLAVAAGQTLTLGAGATLTEGSGGGTLAGPGSIVNDGLIQVSATGLTIGAGFDNAGSITIASGSTLDLSGFLTLAQLGAIGAASDGLIYFDGTLDLAGGTLNVAAGSGLGDVEIAGTVENGTIDQNGGTLVIDPSATLIGVTVACFRRGTHLETIDGEVTIERLRVGDLVRTASGPARAIRWIGHRATETATLPDPREAWPVRIAAGAFAPGLPRRDLWLSPRHAVLIESPQGARLVPIIRLANGGSIAQTPAERVEYWHVELDGHDVIAAEGLACETYLDTGTRGAFVEGPAFVAAHPHLCPHHWTDTCLPLEDDGETVAATRAALVARAASLGHVWSNAHDLHAMAGGVRIEAVKLGPARFGFLFEAGARDIRLVSRLWCPAQSDLVSSDVRLLGVCIARLQVDGSDVPLAVGAWHEAEDGGRRWTAGDIVLAEGARMAIVDLLGEGRYHTAPARAALSVVA